MSKSKILIFDIETSPNIVYCWQTGFKLNIGPENIIDERQVICISYKWLGERKVHTLSWDYKKTDTKDKQILKKFSKVYSEADMIVGHNGDNFDIKWIKTRILFHGLAPLPIIKQYDTLKVCRSQFKLNSNKLDYIAKFLGNEGKSPMCFGDWKKIMEGDSKSLKKMIKYCEQDVNVLEKVYKEISRYVPGKVNKTILTKFDGSCPECSSKINKHGLYMTETGRYQRYRCTNHECRRTWKDTRMLK
jgi:DNA polymerase elongation subunit (family B)